MSALDDVIKDINKKYKEKIIGKSDVKQRNYKKIPFVTPSLTFLFHGGMPRTVAELAGAPGVGKSSLSYSICGQAQKQLKKEYEEEVSALEEIEKPNKEQKERLAYLKERGYQKVAYLDSEFSTSNDWLEKNGVDVDDLIFIAPDNQTAEQLFEITLRLIASDGIGCFILDSIPALVSQQTMEKTMEEKTMAGISQPLSVFSSKLLPLCNKHKCLFIGINQTRADMSGYNRVITPGGKMWQHTCSIRLLLKKGKFFDDKYADLKAHPEDAYGNYSEVEVIKNKATKPNRRLSKFAITYTKGVDGYIDTVNMAITYGIIKQKGAWYSYENDNGEVIESESGEPCSFAGKLKLMDYLERNKDIFDRISKQLNNAIIED